MMTLADNKVIVSSLLQMIEKEAYYLLRTSTRLNALNIDIYWVKSLDKNDEASEMLDAFVARYSRLQDALGDKLLPALLRLSLEKTGSQLDNLFKAEKLGWVESAETWIELRELRNRLVHEYIKTADDLLASIKQALSGVPVLFATQQRMKKYATQFIFKRNSF